MQIDYRFFLSERLYFCVLVLFRFIWPGLKKIYWSGLSLVASRGCLQPITMSAIQAANKYPKIKGRQRSLRFSGPVSKAPILLSKIRQLFVPKVIFLPHSSILSTSVSKILNLVPEIYQLSLLREVSINVSRLMNTKNV